MSLPEEIDIDWINRWLEHGDRKRIAKETGVSSTMVTEVLKKRSKNFRILKMARDIAKQNERTFNS